ncbi:MAG: FAD-dependent monooxygenase, partial [Acidobacteriaceae bacterium]
MSIALDVLIVGAGPYGLSIAAHLRSHGISSGIFGPPMEVWREHMPKGMLLKSDGFASNLSDPGTSFPLKRFCEMRGIHYHDTDVPVAIETFIDYALAFQEKLVPHLDTRRVARIDRTADGYSV